MSNKFIGLYVAFEKEISEEYLEIIKKMILSLKSVCSVEANVSDMSHWIAYEQARNDLQKKMVNILWEKK